MNRRILFITIIYIIGIIWGIYFKINIFLFLFSMVCIGILCIYLKIKIWTVIFILSISVIYSSHVNNIYDDINFNNEKIIISATIIEKVSNEYCDKYLISIKKINNKFDYRNYKAILLIKNSNDKLDIGDDFIISGIFEKAEGSGNFRGFNYNEYLRSNKIIGTITSSKDDEKYVVNTKKWSLKKIFNKIYINIENRINLILNGDQADICTALTLGNKDVIDDKIVEYFSDSSLAYVLAISGMHITYIISFLSIILRSFGKRKKNIGIILFLIMYNNIIGDNVSIVRSIIMNCIFIIGMLIHRKSDSITNISVAALFILLINPYCINNYSFLFSFGGTIGIIVFGKEVNNLMLKVPIINRKLKILEYIRSSISISISANIFIMPITIICSHKISLLFIFSNIIANFLISIIIPMIIISLLTSCISIELSKLLSTILGIFIKVLIYISKLFSNKITNINICRPYLFSIVFYYLIVIVIFFITKSNKKIKEKLNKLLRIFFITYISICLVTNLFSIYNKKLRIYFIDVGQGDSTLIVTESNKTILIDGGGSEFGNNDIGKDVLLPYLLNRRIKKIDYAIISHFDTDHIRPEYLL